MWSFLKNFKNSDKKDITESCFDTKDLNQQIFVEHDVKQPNPNPEHDYDQMKTFIINSRQTFLNDVFTFLTEVGSAGRIVNNGTSSVNSEFVTALNT
jgi:hypothetical protein